MQVARTRVAIMRGALLLALAVAASTVVAPAEADHRDRGPDSAATYKIIELGPAAGGTGSAANSITGNGWVGGSTDLPGVSHATLWRDGEATDLGTLGGPNSAVLWPNRNTNGLVVGVAETAEMDPLGEDWSCSVFFPSVTGHVCRGFAWEDGEMRALPTFGGTHGFATAVNNDGLVTGWAETRRKDRSCVGRNQQLQFLGAVWDTRRGDTIRRLRPLPGDSTSTGNAINDRGQVVGISGSCDQAVGRFSARAAVLWNPGQRRPIDLGNLGSQTWNTPGSINNNGVVVGFANAEGVDDGMFAGRPFRWTESTGMVDLGTLDGDPQGQALGVNDDGLIVGVSRAAPNTREHRDHAVIWRDGEITDLNDLAPGYDGHLVYAGDINNDGVIVGLAITADSQFRAFRAEPIE